MQMHVSTLASASPVWPAAHISALAELLAQHDPTVMPLHMSGGVLSLCRHVPAMASLAFALQAQLQDDAAAYLPQHLLSPSPMPPPPSLATPSAPSSGSAAAFQAQQQQLPTTSAGGTSGGISSEQR